MGTQTEKIALMDTIEAAAELPRRRFVALDGGLCGSGAKAHGVCTADMASGDQAPVAVYGIVIVESGAAITAKDAITSDSTGRAVTAAALAAALTLATPAGTISFPTSSSVAMKSDAEHPVFTFAGSATTGTAALTGGVLPIAINGYALDGASGAGEFIRVRLV